MGTDGAKPPAYARPTAGAGADAVEVRDGAGSALCPSVAAAQALVAGAGRKAGTMRQRLRG